MRENGSFLAHLLFQKQVRSEKMTKKCTRTIKELKADQILPFLLLQVSDACFINATF